MHKYEESYVLKQFSWTKDLAVLAARVALGVVFVAHGAQKLFTWGLSGTADAFQGMGVPAPQASALLATLVELVGGVALVVGFAVPVAGLLLALDMLGGSCSCTSETACSSTAGASSSWPRWAPPLSCWQRPGLAG